MNRHGELLIVLLTLSRSLAAQSPEQVRIVVAAGSGCTTNADFVPRVRERTSMFSLAGPTAAVREFRVSVDTLGTHGTLTIVGSDGSTSVREIHGGSCAETVPALSLVAALAIDPKAKTELPLAPPPAPSPAPPPPAPAPEPAAPEARIELQISGGALLGSAPSLRPYAASRMTVAFGPFASIGWMPYLRAGALAHLPKEDPAAGAALSSFGISATLDACPLGLRSSFVRVHACGTADLGGLRVSGGQIASPETIWQPWISAGGSALLEGAITSHLIFGLEASWQIPIDRRQYVFGPDSGPRTVAWDVPRFTHRYGASMGWRF